MKQIATLFQERPAPIRRQPTSKRAYWLQVAIDEVGFPQSDFGKLMGQTKQMTVDEIEEIILKAKAWRVNPQALFWKLVNERKEIIKNQLSKAK